MPGYNGTGPAGMGPRTGKGFGPCGLGFGWRKKFGAGRGMGRYFDWQWPYTRKEQSKALKDYKQALKEELEDIEKEEQELQADQ